ncbi:hypothetical protein [Mammaliicoccus lentus]|uniref:hypothetical protein n=1 Tax=Mammaliicoccus lentus TaxID=42858 RepID=UPI0007D9757A|nr:hypothetical protein [Mammaliicoccus lentus]OAO24848.1 hypothetical protein AXY34_02710 [Mammaliicoccus lentus]
MNKKFNFLCVIFLPMFFSIHGIYKGVIAENGLHLGESGLIFPLIFFFGIYSCLSIVYHSLKTKELIINKNVIVIIISIITYAICITSIGYISHLDIIVFLRLIQFLSFIFGFSIYYHLFIIKKYNFNLFFNSLFKLLLFIVVMHYISSLIELGFINSIKSISPNIYGFGIYQSRVYYPYLVVCIFYFSINFISNNKLKIIGILLIGLYVFSLQVRGALISYILFTTLFFILNIKNKLCLLLLTLLTIVIGGIGFKNLGEASLGRFGDIGKFVTFNGRLDIWAKDLVINNPSQLLIGNLFYDPDNISSHNQYINFYVYGGATLLLMMGIIIIPFVFLLLKTISYKDNRLIFILLSFFIPIIVDLNVNVPLNNLNSSIIYTFIWNCAYIYTIKELNKYEEI